MNEENKNSKDNILTITIPYIVWESDKARRERREARLIGVIILLILCFTGYVLYDKWDAAQWDYADTTETVDVITDGGGDANYIKNGGEINNGEDTSNNEKKNENETE